MKWFANVTDFSTFFFVAAQTTTKQKSKAGRKEVNICRRMYNPRSAADGTDKNTEKKISQTSIFTHNTREKKSRSRELAGWGRRKNYNRGREKIKRANWLIGTYTAYTVHMEVVIIILRTQYIFEAKHFYFFSFQYVGDADTSRLCLAYYV